jgi:predicted metal-binding membrane protein
MTSGSIPVLALRRQLAAATALGGLAIAAWLLSVGRMSGGGMGGRFEAGALGSFVVLWVLMMAAMMFPSAWPAVAVFNLVARQKRANGFLGSGGFLLGYIAAWTAIGVAAFGVLALVRRTGLADYSALDLTRYLVAPVALAAAAYQLLPFKQACLKRCRGPLSFFLGHWRDGIRGAFQMGARHGAYCVGCCWVLMALLLALGVMSVAWMAVVAVAIAVEKLAPARYARLATRAVTASLLLLAVVALVRPGWISHNSDMSMR